MTHPLNLLLAPMRMKAKIKVQVVLI
ncbi:hypothetical protein RDI58_012372 [Solanum bulbocastanum]|uniref:Uncharacterized protein n=1 Tax=Solanum bulbocastanum TaxID=147425 RepID=A0AAN8YD19_SOLBU